MGHAAAQAHSASVSVHSTSCKGSLYKPKLFLSQTLPLRCLWCKFFLFKQSHAHAPAARRCLCAALSWLVYGYTLYPSSTGWVETTFPFWLAVQWRTRHGPTGIDIDFRSIVCSAHLSAAPQRPCGAPAALHPISRRSAYSAQNQPFHQDYVAYALEVIDRSCYRPIANRAVAA